MRRPCPGSPPRTGRPRAGPGWDRGCRHHGRLLIPLRTSSHAAPYRRERVAHRTTLPRAEGAPASGAGQRQVGHRDDVARGVPAREQSLGTTQPDEQATHHGVERHVILLSSPIAPRLWDVPRFNGCACGCLAAAVAARRRRHAGVAGALPGSGEFPADVAQVSDDDGLARREESPPPARFQNRT